MSLISTYGEQAGSNCRRLVSVRIEAELERVSRLRKSRAFVRIYPDLTRFPDSRLHSQVNYFSTCRRHVA
jgi:hypothetical protein